MWYRKRGAAVRLMGVLLREDDSMLERPGVRERQDR